MTVTTPHPNPQHPRLYPSHLEKFQQCRRRYSLQMEERRPSQARVTLALTKGNVTHQVLKICGSEWQESASMPADLRSLVAPRLPRADYPSAAAWESDVAQVVEWIKYGLSYLDPYATILGVERFLDRT